LIRWSRRNNSCEDNTKHTIKSIISSELTLRTSLWYQWRANCKSMLDSNQGMQFIRKINHFDLRKWFLTSKVEDGKIQDEHLRDEYLFIALFSLNVDQHNTFFILNILFKLKIKRDLWNRLWYRQAKKDTHNRTEVDTHRIRQ